MLYGMWTFAIFCIVGVLIIYGITAMVETFGEIWRWAGEEPILAALAAIGIIALLAIIAKLKKK